MREHKHNFSNNVASIVVGDAMDAKSFNVLACNVCGMSKFDKRKVKYYERGNKKQHQTRII